MTPVHAGSGEIPRRSHGTGASISMSPAASSRPIRAAVTSLLTLATTIGESLVAGVPSMTLPAARCSSGSPSRQTDIVTAALARARLSKTASVRPNSIGGATTVGVVVEVVDVVEVDVVLVDVLIDVVVVDEVVDVVDGGVVEVDVDDAVEATATAGVVASVESPASLAPHDVSASANSSAPTTAAREGSDTPTRGA